MDEAPPPAAPPVERRTAMNYVDGFVAAVPTANREAYGGYAVMIDM